MPDGGVVHGSSFGERWITRGATAPAPDAGAPTVIRPSFTTGERHAAFGTYIFDQSTVERVRKGLNRPA
jgi:hypothetical protein